MQIGNVPPKEWLESLAEEKNKATIKDATNQYALTLFQNEDENTLKKECIEAIKSHEWFNDGVKDVDKATFIEDLNKLTKEGLFLLARHTGEMQAELYYEGESRYNIKENKIYTNLKKTPITHGADKAIGFKIGMRAFLHEAGHWLDSNVLGVKNGIRDKLPELDSKIKNDVLNVINKVGRQAVQKGYIKDFTDLKQLTQSSIKSLPDGVKFDLSKSIEGAINSSISDLYGGATSKQVKGDYGHKSKYWEREKMLLASEAVAHLIEAVCSGSKRIKPMKQFLP